MTAKAKAPARPIENPTETDDDLCPWSTPPRSLEERLQRIRTMQKRIHGYIEFLGKISKLSSTSTEAKEKAVAAFYDRMAVMERHLARIQEELLLG